MTVASSHVRRLQSRVARTADRFVNHANVHDLTVADLPAAKLPWYEIRSKAVSESDDESDTATILLFDEIGGSFGVDSKTFAEDLEAITDPVIHLRINSPGGSVFDAIAIHSALLHHPARVVVYIDALAASAASVVAMAGDEIVMMPGSQMMIHDASALEDGNAADMARMSTLLERQSDNVADLYRRKGGGAVGDWRTLMLTETWLFANEAVEFGLADRVEEKRKPIRDPQADELLTRSFDLSQFRYAGRRHAPIPGYRTTATTRTANRSAELRFMSSAVQQQSGRRFGNLTRVEVRTLSDGSVHVEGHAAVFDVATQIGPAGVGFEERIASGAFKKTISDGADVRFLFNHNPDLVLARTKSGTLSLLEDKIGLAVTADLAPTSVGRDLAILLERGDVSQMSFGFQVVKDQWETVTRDDDGSVEVRTILEARLFDVSAVTYPAYDETDLAIREATLARELRDARAPKLPKEPALATPPEPETPEDPAESGVSSSPEPASLATPFQVEERGMPLHELLLRHANGHHTLAPRVLCPACNPPAAG